MIHTRVRRRLPFGCSRHGFTRTDVVTLLLIVVGLLLVVSMLLPAFRRERRHAIQQLCGRNLAEIGKAMLVYANDHHGALPVAGGKGTVWGPGLDDWKAASRDAAFGCDANGVGGEATISASLYLLARYGGASPDLFVCPKDKGTTAFRPAKYGIGAEGLSGAWDSGPDPARHCSYAYHMPYSGHALTTSAEPGVAVAADRNPWIDGPRQKAAEFSLFTPDIGPFKGTVQQGCQGSSLTHRGGISHHDGQTVLFLDSHVEFAKRAFCGLEDDNIYTAWDGDDKVRGVPPKAYDSQPADARDSLLLNDPPLKR